MSAAELGETPKARAALIQAIDVKKHFLVGSSLFQGQRKTVYAGWSGNQAVANPPSGAVSCGSTK
jgi:hypothetical protein